MDKSALRTTLRDRRRTHCEGLSRRFPLSDKLHQKIVQSEYIGSYCAFQFEPDMTDINYVAAEINKRLCLPFVAGRGAQMSFKAWDIDDPLETAGFGFRQPSEAAPAARPDLILVPLVGFDRQMRRLGQGAGHYDRYLEAHPQAFRLGIGWSIQEVENLPGDPWDQPLDAVCTEKEWISVTTPRKIAS